MLPPIYLRKERTRCEMTLRQLVPLREAQRDVVAYDAPGGAPVVRWDWWNSQKPTRRNRAVMLNCARRQAVWLADEEG